MRRIKLAVVAVAVMAAMLTAVAGPALADCDRTRPGIVRCGEDNNRFIREDLIDHGRFDRGNEAFFVDGQETFFPWWLWWWAAESDDFWFDD